MKLDLKPVADLSKRERIEFLLNHWLDFRETLNKGERGDGTEVKLPPGMSRHPSVVELFRCIKIVQDHAPTRYSHFENFYTAEKLPRSIPMKRKTKKGKTITVNEMRLVRQVPPWVRAQKVRDCVDLIVDGFQGDARLPRELTENVFAEAA